MEFLDKRDVVVLRILDGLRPWYEWLPIKKIVEKSPFDEEKVHAIIKKLQKNSLLQVRHFQRVGHTARITNLGLDALALWDLRKHGVIGEITVRISRGKEARIVRCFDPRGGFLVVKLHRYWRKEFRKIKKSLNYASVVIRGHELNLEDYEIDVPRAKAQVEFRALCKAFKHVSVPEPRGINRHAVVMKFVPWDEKEEEPARMLVDVKLKNPKDAFELIFEDYLTILEKAGFVHGDFSPYNILITSEGELYYIDWPQAVPLSYELSHLLIERDLTCIINHFRSKYKLEIPKDLISNALEVIR